jgi:hypothetical protein
MVEFLTDLITPIDPSHLRPLQDNRPRMLSQHLIHKEHRHNRGTPRGQHRTAKDTGGRVEEGHAVGSLGVPVVDHHEHDHLCGR